VGNGIHAPYPGNCGTVRARGAHVAPAAPAWTIGTTFRGGLLSRHRARLADRHHCRPAVYRRNPADRPQTHETASVETKLRYLSPILTEPKKNVSMSGRIQRVTVRAIFSRFILLLFRISTRENCRRWHDNHHTLVRSLSESDAGDEVIMSIPSLPPCSRGTRTFDPGA
jgi:hypothetical protein